MLSRRLEGWAWADAVNPVRVLVRCQARGVIDDGRAGLDHFGRLVLTGLGMGGLAGATTSAVVMLTGGEAGSEYLQGYLLAGVALGMVVGVVAGAGIALVALAAVSHRPRSASGLEPVTVFAAVVLTVPVVVIACVWLDAAAAVTVVAVAVTSIEAVLALRVTRRWRWAALGR